MEPKYPNIKVKLVGEDGNAFNIMGIVRQALRENKVSKDEINKFMEEARSGNYDDLLQTCMKWVTVY